MPGHDESTAGLYGSALPERDGCAASAALVRRRPARIIALLATLALLGCAPMGDNAGGIQGSIVDAEGRGFESCTLDLYQQDGALIDERKIGSVFREVFSLSPRVSEYRVVIQCDGSEEEYAAKRVVLGTRASYVTPVDLGQITLRREP
jgi:hypothetical protein